MRAAIANLVRIAGIVLRYVPDWRIIACILFLHFATYFLAARYWPIAILFAAGGAALGWLAARQRRFQLVGPLFYWETIRLARSGWMTWLRCGYALVLLAALRLVYESWQSGPSHTFQEMDHPSTAVDMARLGESYATTLLIIQYLAALGLPLLYSAGAVCEERSRQTLEYLFASHLEDREIILGKLFSRTAAVLLVLAAALPILALMQFWGGVDIRIIVAAFIAVTATCFHVGSITICCSTVFRNQYFVLLAAFCGYGVSIVGLAIANFGVPPEPLTFLARLEADLRGGSSGWSLWSLLPSANATADQALFTVQQICKFTLGQTLASLFWCHVAMVRLRQPVIDGIVNPPNPRENIPYAIPVNRPKYRPRKTYRSWALDQNPLWWKENRSVPQVHRRTLITFGLWFFIYVLIGGILYANQLLNSNIPVITPELGSVNTIRWFSILTAGGATFIAMFAVMHSVIKERERRAMDFLLTLPIDRWKVYLIKAISPWWHFFWFGIIAIFLWGVFSSLLILNPLWALPAICSVFVIFSFFIVLAMWLAQVCKTPLRAYLTLGCVLLALVAGPWLLFSGQYFQLNFLFNPIGIWWVIEVPWHPQRETAFERPEFALAGIAIYAAATAILWRLGLRLLLEK